MESYWKTAGLIFLSKICRPLNPTAQLRFREQLFRRKYLDPGDPESFAQGLENLDTYAIWFNPRAQDPENRDLMRTLIERTANDDPVSVECRRNVLQSATTKLLTTLLADAIKSKYDEIEIGFALPFASDIWYGPKDKRRFAMRVPVKVSHPLLREARFAASFDPGIYFYNAPSGIETISVTTLDFGATSIKINPPSDLEPQPAKIPSPPRPVTPIRKEKAALKIPPAIATNE